MELFKILGRIAIDNEIANKELDETSGKAEQAHSRISSAFDKIGSAATKVGKVMAAGLAAGAAAFAGLTTKALNIGGELEQNMGGSEAVFGEYAKGMRDKASKAFNKMGLSASDFLATANKMGALFQGAGFGIEESANLSAEAMQRASDVASIMGIDVSSAMEAVAGAAKGNFAMMDNLGVAMNETTLANYALEKGIKKSYSAMTQQEKIGLAMEMFLDKTAYAANNYAKENETLAGSMTTAKAAFDNFLSGSGTVDDLVDTVLNAGTVIMERIQELLPRLVEGLNQLIATLLPYLPGIIETLLPGIITGATALLTGLISALPTILEILIQQIPFILEQIGIALIAAFPVLFETVKNLFGQIWDYIAVELLGTEADFETSMGKIAEIFSGAWAVLQYIWTSVGQPIWDMIQSAVDIVRNAFSERMPEIREFVSGCFSDIKAFWENNLKPCFDAIGNFIENVLAPIFKEVFETRIKGAIDNAFRFIKSLWEDFLKPVFTGITDFLTGVFTGNWAQVWEGIKSILLGILNGIVAGIEFMLNGAINMINGLISGINKVIGLAGDLLGLNIAIPLIPAVEIPRYEEGGVLERGEIGLLEGTGAEAVVPLERNKKWISAVARDMESVGMGGSDEKLQRIIDLLEMLIVVLPESMKDAIAELRFELNRREFGRLVKAVE